MNTISPLRFSGRANIVNALHQLADDTYHLSLASADPEYALDKQEREHGIQQAALIAVNDPAFHADEMGQYFTSKGSTVQYLHQALFTRSNADTGQREIAFATAAEAIRSAMYATGKGGSVEAAEVIATMKQVANQT